MRLGGYFLKALLAVFLISCCVSCERRHQLLFWHDYDHFSDGETYFIVVEREEGIQAVQAISHSSGSRVYRKIDRWLVQWNISELQQDRTNGPNKVIYLGRYESRRKGMFHHTYEKSGIDLPQHRTRFATEFVFRIGEELELYGLTNQFSGPPIRSIPIGDSKNVMFSRSRRYLFVWQPTPTLYLANSLEVIKVIPQTENFRAFDAAFHRVENHTVALTDDLKYLVAVPHNGGESPQGFNHCKAYCYGLDDDRFTTNQIRFGLNSTAISTVESVAGDLQFVAYSDDKRLAILAANSKLLSDLPSDNTRFFNFNSNFQWDYRNHRVFVSDDEIDIHSPEREFTLTEFDYGSGGKRSFTLNAGLMVVPK